MKIHEMQLWRAVMAVALFGAAAALYVSLTLAVIALAAAALLAVRFRRA